MGVPSPLLAEGPGCGPPPFLAREPAGVGGGWPLAIPGRGSWVRFPATPGWGLSAALLAVSAGLGGGFPVLCVFGARRVLVCALCFCGGGVGVGVPAVRVGACVACIGWFPLLRLAAGVGVGVAGVCCGWSLATAGGGS